jgi:soluble lytic murein transglycosylase-like protein
MNNPLHTLMNTATWRTARADIWLGMRHVSRDTLALLGLTILLGGIFLVNHAPLRSRLEAHAYGWLADRANARLMPQSLLAFGGRVTNPSSADILLDLAEPDAIERATAADPATLSRQQAAVVRWISKRYAVAQEPVSRLAQEAWAVGRKVGIDPTLILAVMAIESRYNPFAQSHVGAQGLMQVMTKIHQDKYDSFGGKQAAFDPVTNLRVGVQVLKDCIKAAGSVELGLKHYVGAANLAHDSGYGAKVLAEQAYLKQVMVGQNVAITATWPKFNATQVAQLVQNEAALALVKAEPASDKPVTTVLPKQEPLVTPPPPAPASVTAPAAASTTVPVAMQENTGVKPAGLGIPKAPAAPSSAPTFSHDGAQVAMAS